MTDPDTEAMELWREAEDACAQHALASDGDQAALKTKDAEHAPE